MSEQIKITVHQDEIAKCMKSLMCAFKWSETIDGEGYWRDVVMKLEGLKFNCTNNYKPLSPEITDEWLVKFITKHGRRPMVHVKDHVALEWSKEPIELYAVRKGFTQKFMAAIGCWAMCKLADDEPRA